MKSLCGCLPTFSRCADVVQISGGSEIKGARENQEKKMQRQYIYSPQQSLFGTPDIIGYGSETFHIKEIEKNKSKDIIIKNHYSHKVCNDATTRIHLGVFMNSLIVGVLQYGYAMNPLSMDKIVSGTELNEYLELNRMWLDDIAPRNSESMAISYTIKYIKKRFPKIKWIQSFADERCGKFGIVYQAANFKYFGEHTSTFWIIENEIFHNSILTNNNRGKKAELESKYDLSKAEKMILRQFRYIYFIDKKYEKNVLLKQKQYEKHYKTEDARAENQGSRPNFVQQPQYAIAAGN